ncbi:hypothetical protein [Flavobacterium sp.]|uniref:hypothetical protein n=1 Tax=Flavobacterium sp. TaxID=239 RepID=UPI0026227FB5|nr:hypothetical protein [Flavobacterium sp.]
MIYKFKKYNISSPSTPKEKIQYEFSVDYDLLNNEEKVLFHIGSHLWTSQKIQELINDSNDLQGENEFQYQVDGGHLGIIVTKTDGVAFFDLTNREKEEEDFIWPFEKFINFLKDFKRFVEENS